jgi:hypothetical protein
MAGHAFGATGPCERLTAIARGELDPADPRNRAIVNLDKAPRDATAFVDEARSDAVSRRFPPP